VYTALTNELVRYPYQAGDNTPSGPAQMLATFPDYGLPASQGGWHLTRTVAFHDDKLFVSVGSSCNSCEEKTQEAIRASILEMNPDGSDSTIYASGLRNAVGIAWVGDELFATAMGADNLGNDAPQDDFLQVQQNQNYGWPYCYEQNGQILADDSQQWLRKQINCATDVSLAYDELGAHVAPLGFDYFSDATNPALKNYFLVALHGSGNAALDQQPEIVRVQKGITPQVIVSGFQPDGTNRFGRPADVLDMGNNSFLFTDDYKGIIYYVSQQ
jgi:glucose/arabinose dehydrogenase